MRNRGRGEGGLRCVRAWTSFSRARGTSGTDEGALDRINSVGHRAVAADHHDRTSAKPKLANDIIEESEHGYRCLTSG
jgi:hypothetical protein